MRNMRSLKTDLTPLEAIEVTNMIVQYFTPNIFSTWKVTGGKLNACSTGNTTIPHGSYSLTVSRISKGHSMILLLLSLPTTNALAFNFSYHKDKRQDINTVELKQKMVGMLEEVTSALSRKEIADVQSSVT